MSFYGAGENLRAYNRSRIFKLIIIGTIIILVFVLIIPMALHKEHRLKTREKGFREYV